MLAILLGLFGSFWFAVSMVLINRGVLSVDYFRGLLTNLGVNALFLWIYVLIFTDKSIFGAGQSAFRDDWGLRSRDSPLFHFQRHGAPRRVDILLFDE